MKKTYIPLLLVAVNFAVFALQYLVPGLTESFLLDSSAVAERPWILVTSMFLHGSHAHLIGNMFALALFGLMLENIIGSRKFLAVYFAAGIISGIAAAFFYDSTLGASGAIFGVLGMLAALRPKMIVWTYGVPLPMIAAAGLWLLLDILGVFYPTNVANMAHIAGLALGAAIGAASKQKDWSRPKRKKTMSDEEFEEWEEEYFGKK